MELVLACLVIGVVFYLLAVVTEDFFVPAIDKAADRLKLSSDASGATLLAIGSSAPEFFTALIATSGLAGPQANDVGNGTIVGSALFNILIIVGLSAMYRTVHLQWQPVVRDLVFYIIATLLLLIAFWDGQIVIWETLAFLATYAIYITSVVHWRKWLRYKHIVTEEKIESEIRKSAISRYSVRALSYIIPDPIRWPKLYSITLVSSILIIGGLSWVLVDQLMVIAASLSINPTVLALTVAAVGTSVPDTIGSIVVAKQGRGDMAVSNAVGSNTFNILFALSVPWLIVLMSGGSVKVSNTDLTASVLLMLASVIAILFLLIARRWRISRRSGLILILAYLAYILYVTLS